MVSTFSYYRDGDKFVIGGKITCANSYEQATIDMTRIKRKHEDAIITSIETRFHDALGTTGAGEATIHFTRKTKAAHVDMDDDDLFYKREVYLKIDATNHWGVISSPLHHVREFAKQEKLRIYQRNLYCGAGGLLAGDFWEYMLRGRIIRKTNMDRIGDNIERPYRN